MRAYRRRALLLALPLKSLTQRFTLILLIGVSLALLIWGRAEPKFLDSLRTNVGDITTPFLEIVSHPAGAIATLIDGTHSMVYIYEKNAQLEQENTNLLKEQMLYKKILIENIKLREMLRVVPDPEASYITARVIADSGGPFVRTILINAGTKSNVRKGQAVITHIGLVGRVVRAGKHSARILLLTDLNSRIPVVIEHSRESAILAGDNTNNPQLQFLPIDADIKVGSRIITSGQGGVFPPGIAVGLISSISADRILIQPYADWDRLEYVTILDYLLPGFLPETQRAGRIEVLQ